MMLFEKLCSSVLMSKLLKIRVTWDGRTCKNEMKCIRFFHGLWGK